MAQDGNGNTTEPLGGGTTTERGLPALVYKGELIHERHEMLSLTDMWRAAGSPDSRRPDDWKKDASNRAFLDHVAMVANTPVKGIWKGQRGTGGGTFGHWQIALAYAKYLDHDFHMWCNRVVRERMEGVAHHAVGLNEDDRRAIGGIAKGVVAKALGDLMPDFLANALTLILPGMVKSHLETDTRAVAVGYKPALMILIEKKVPSKRRRAFSQKVSARLRRFSADHGYETRISRESGRWLFQVEAINAWLAHEGEQLIRSHIASLEGQGVLRLVQP